MKNWEFCEEQLRKYNLAFAMNNDNHNQISSCESIRCDRCAFSASNQSEPVICDVTKIKWLYQEHKEPAVLTNDEKSLCKLLGRGWIARDKDNSLWWYKNRPKEKLDDGWCIPNSTINVKISKYFPQCKFDFIKWEDEEPWEVKVND